MSPVTDPHAVHTPADVPDLTVVEFLRARLDEDEQVAQEALNDGSGEWTWDCPHEGLADPPPSHDLCAEVRGEWIVVYNEGGHTPGQARHIARHDPARVLRDVTAKRRIVDLHDGSHECSSHGDNCTWIDGDLRPHCDTLALLAEVYDQHPDYNERWRP